MIIWQQLNDEQRQQVLQRPQASQQQETNAIVADIISNIAARGDEALFSCTKQFDGVTLDAIAVSDQQRQQAQAQLSAASLKAIDNCYDRIARFHQAQQPNDILVETTPGLTCKLKYQPISSVGLYVPGGSAPLPSTALMLGVPAQIAGCPRKVMVCPPNRAATICPEILYIANKCEVDEVYCLGGAQAIAALALGTESIPAVNKIYGPGNQFVTVAKQQLAATQPGLSIDMPAGPSELLVIADESAKPEYIAADLLSQLEHGVDSQTILLTTSARLISAVKQALFQQISTLHRQAIIQQAIQHCKLILVQSLAEAVNIANDFGAEHLSIQTLGSANLAENIRNSGSLFIGELAAETIGDYASGTNHVLPTNGYARSTSSLNLLDFYRCYTTQTVNQQALNAIAADVITLTDIEGLSAHQNALTIRLQDNLQEVV